ncbi:hypothetical protein, partial [Rhodoplanes sp. SY1]|uniref:hypothetical protein n=1 Tax=Rhodoplanes sp. SY1 TaxID=3166646 RepID=UPI0038B44E0A
MPGFASATRLNFEPVRKFLHGARGRSQEEIIISFLIATVIEDPIASHGAVLISHKNSTKLSLFNQDDFLFNEKLLDPKHRASWRMEFSSNEGIAGLCFDRRSTQVFCRKTASSEMIECFVGNSPIENMVCIP